MGKEVKDPVVKTGFARGIPIEKVLGATREPGELMFFIKWRGVDNPELVTAKEAYVKAPIVFLKWYERQLVWNEDPVKTDNVKADDLKSETKKSDDSKLEASKVERSKSVDSRHEETKSEKKGEETKSDKKEENSDKSEKKSEGSENKSEKPETSKAEESTT